MIRSLQLSDAQRKRLARKATRLLSYSQLEAKCLIEELGTPVAEDFVEGAIEYAAEALALLAKVKCSLRIGRVEKGGAK